MTTSKQQTATLFGFLAIFLWSANALLAVELKRIPSFELIAIVFGISATTSLSFIAFKNRWDRLKQPPLVWAMGIFGIYFTNFGSIIKSEFILQFRTLTGNDKATSEYNKIISNYAKSSTLLHSEASGDGKTVKISLDIVMKESMEQNELISKISNINGLTEVVLVAAKSDVDY